MNGDRLTTDTTRPKRFVVTGGGGYIGIRLCQRLLAEGYGLTVLGRTRPQGLNPVDYTFLTYDLADAVPAGALDDAEALVHLAHVMDDEETESLNEAGTARLLAAIGQKPEMTFIYVSSQSARPEAPTAYGRVKARIEALVTTVGGVIVRPGFVYGGDPRGAFGMLCKLVQSLPVVPVIGRTTEIQPVHVDDLCRALIWIGSGKIRRAAYNIAAPLPLSYRDFLKSLAHNRYDRHIRTLPVPLSITLLAARLCRWMPGLPDVPEDRIRGLTEIVSMETADSLQALEMTLCPLAEGLREGRIRPLLVEARIVLRYIGGRPAPFALLRRYVRAVRSLEGGAPLGFSAIVRAWPALLRFCEPFGGPPSPLTRRLNIAVSILEMSPEGARRFAAYTPENRIALLLCLGGLLVLEGLILPLRWLRR